MSHDDDAQLYAAMAALDEPAQVSPELTRRILTRVRVLKTVRDIAELEMSAPVWVTQSFAGNDANNKGEKK